MLFFKYIPLHIYSNIYKLTYSNWRIWSVCYVFFRYVLLLICHNTYIYGHPITVEYHMFSSSKPDFVTEKLQHSFNSGTSSFLIHVILFPPSPIPISFFTKSQFISFFLLSSYFRLVVFPNSSYFSLLPLHRRFSRTF